MVASSAVPYVVAERLRTRRGLDGRRSCGERDSSAVRRRNDKTGGCSAAQVISKI